MDEYEASCLRIEKISTSIQSIKESLTCRICLELFEEPVTIKCGHKFCRECILRVTNNENSSCPFCNSKIQKRSIPKEGNAVLQSCVKYYENLIKAVQTDSGIDVSQPYKKAKNTKESSVEYSMPSTFKLEDTPSTSKGSSSIFDQKSVKPKVTNPVKSRLSLTKKKTDVKSPSQNSAENTLHKYYQVSNQVVHSQEKVQSWLDKISTAEDNDSIVRDSIQGPSKPLKDNFTIDQIGTPPDQICCSSRNNEIKEDDSSPLASGSKFKETEMRLQEFKKMAKKMQMSLNVKEKNNVKPLKDNFTIDQIGTPPDQICCSSRNSEIKEDDPSPLASGSKFKETEMRLQEFKKMAKKKQMSLNVKEKNNVKTPSSVPATSQSDACNWRRVKEVGRQMQVKTFKTLNVSIERYSPSVAVDDTVIYDSTNNDSKNISHDSQANNTSTDKTPIKTKKCHPLQSENNNLLQKSPQIVIEDYKHRSLDSTASPKQECTAIDVDENQLNEIIGVLPSTSASKTSEKTKTSLKRLKGSNLSSKLNQLSPSKRKSIDQELSNDESSKCDSRTTVINVQNSPSKKTRLSLKSLKSTTSPKSSSPASISDQTNQKEKELSNNFSKEKSNSGLLHEKTNSIGQKIASTKSSLCDNLANKRSSSVSNGCRIIFQKLGKICKKSKNVPFRYLGRLEKEKCPSFNNNPCRKPAILVKSNVPVSIDYKSRMHDINVANLEDFSSDESHSKSILPKNDVPLQSPIKSSTVHKYEEAMNIHENMNVQRPGQSEQKMEIDETLPPAKMIITNNSNLKKRSSENQIMAINLEDSSLKSTRTKRKSLENEDFEKIPSQIDENVPEPLKNTDENDISKHSEHGVERWDAVSKSSLKSTKIEIGKSDLIPESLSKVDTIKNSSNFKQTKSSAENNLEKNDYNRILADLISNSSDDSEAKVHRTNSLQKVGKVKFNESRRKSGQKVSIKSDVESCTESEVSVISGIRGRKNVEDAKHGYSSTSSSSLRTTGKKKRTHSESSNEEDDVVNIIDKWTKKAKKSLDSEKEQVSKKPKITPDSEEMINKNASKVRHRPRQSFSSSSEDEEDTFKENEYQQNSLIDEAASKVKTQITQVNVNKVTAMPSSMLSADLFETNEQSIQPIQSFKKPLSENSVKITSVIDFDAQSDKENISERSPENTTVIDTRQLKRGTTVASRNLDNDSKKNSECNRTSDLNKSIKSTQETVDEIESSQMKRKSIVSKNSHNSDKENNEQKRTSDFNKSIKTAEEHVNEIESSQKDKTVDNFEHESDPYFVRESLLNITQEQIACKNIEKDLFGVDLSKIHENQNEEPLDNDKFSTPRRKPTNSEQNDEFDSDNIAPTPIVRRRPTLRFSSSQSSPGSEGNAADMSSPAKKMALIPAITPMKNTKSYPLCHSTPMMHMDSQENRDHSQIENIKLVCTSLTPENTKLVQKFADRFDAQFQSNFDMDVTHVIVKVDPQTKAGPKTFKYIQGIAFQKYVVSFEWIVDCLAKNKLLDVSDEKYDVLDPDIFESGCKRSRLSSHKLFKNFAFCCMEPFEKVSLSEFEELLTYNGAVIVSSLSEFHLHNNKLKIIIVGTDELNDEGIAILNKAQAAAVYFEWIVDSLSQFQILSLPSYLFETTVEKVRSLGFPPELLVEEETMEEDEDDI